MTDIETRVIKLIADHLDVSIEQVSKMDAKFTDDLGADSLDQVEMIMAFEEEFGIEIPDSQAEKIVKVEDAISFIKEQLKKVA